MIAEAGLTAAIQAIAPGVPERHVAAEAEYTMRKLGAEGMVGTPSDKAKRAVEAAIQAHLACAAKLRAGGDCSAEAAARQIMQDAGFGPNFLYSGIHSVGVIEFKAPIFGPSCNSVMEENMVLSIDIPAFDGEWGRVRAEDGCLIEKDVAKWFTSFEYFVQK